MERAVQLDSEWAAMERRLPYLTANERNSLRTFIGGRLHERYGNDLLRVILFGSKARGDFDEESDLDLFLVVRMPDNAYGCYRNEIWDMAADVELAYGVVMSLVIRDEAGYQKMQRDGLLLVRNIQRDGVDLWTSQPSVSTLPFD